MNTNIQRRQFWRYGGAITYVAVFCVMAVLPCLGIAAPAKSAWVDLSSQWTWVDEKWTGKNADYDKSRSDLDKLVVNSPQFQAMLQKCSDLAQKNSTDPMAQFRWGYRVRRAASRLDDYTTGVKTMYSVNQALASAPSPHTYQYTRLRLLAGNWSVVYYSPARLLHTKSLGKRLLAHNPNDYEVKYVLASILDISGHLDNRQLALKWTAPLK